MTFSIQRISLSDIKCYLPNRTDVLNIAISLGERLIINSIGTIILGTVVVGGSIWKAGGLDDMNKVHYIIHKEVIPLLKLIVVPIGILFFS